MSVDSLNQHLRKTLSRGRVAVSRPAGCERIALYLFDPRVLEVPLSHEEVPVPSPNLNQPTHAAG